MVNRVPARIHDLVLPYNTADFHHRHITWPVPGNTRKILWPPCSELKIITPQENLLSIPAHAQWHYPRFQLAEQERREYAGMRKVMTTMPETVSIRIQCVIMRIHCHLNVDRVKKRIQGGDASLPDRAS